MGKERKRSTFLIKVILQSTKVRVLISIILQYTEVHLRILASWCCQLERTFSAMPQVVEPTNGEWIFFAIVHSMLIHRQDFIKSQQLRCCMSSWDISRAVKIHAHLLPITNQLSTINIRCFLAPRVQALACNPYPSLCHSGVFCRSLDMRPFHAMTWFVGPVSHLWPFQLHASTVPTCNTKCLLMYVFVEMRGLLVIVSSPALALCPSSV